MNVIVTTELGKSVGERRYAVLNRKRKKSDNLIKS